MRPLTSTFTFHAKIKEFIEFTCFMMFCPILLFLWSVCALGYSVSDLLNNRTATNEYLSYPLNLELSEDLGGTWTPSDYLQGGSWFDIASSSTGQYLAAIIATPDAGVYLSQDFGTSWLKTSALPDFSGNSAYQAVASSGDGQYIAVVVSGGPLYVSKDFGENWTNCTGAPSNENTRWETVAVSSSGQYMAAAILGGKMYYSTDYGVTWDRSKFSEKNEPNIHSDMIADYFDIAYSATGQYAAVAVGGDTGLVYYSSDYASTFDPSDFPANLPAKQWVGVAMDASGWNVTATNSQIQGGMFVSSDRGQTFTQLMTAPNLTAMSDVCVSEDGAVMSVLNLGIAAGPTAAATDLVGVTSSARYVYVSVDFGANWTTTSPVGNWESIAMTDDGSLIVAADYGTAFYTYLPNCPLGYVHSGFSTDGSSTNPCVACSAGTYTEGLGSASCTECSEGTYSSTSAADGEGTCRDCPYPMDTLGSGGSDCPVVWINMSALGLMLFVGALFALLVIIFLFGNDNQMVVLVIMVFPALDVLTDLVYLLISRFYNITVFVLCVLFFLHPAPMFCQKLYRYRALPYSIRYIWWIGASTSFAARAAIVEKDTTNPITGSLVGGDGSGGSSRGDGVGQVGGEDALGDHIPYPTILGRRFSLLISFEHHDNLYVVVLELLTWAVAIALQALTFLALPAFLVFWFFVGVFLQMTKTIAMGTVWNIWFYVWTGYDLWQDTEGTVDTEDLNYGLLSQFVFETVPHIILQSVNNTLLGTWVSDPIAILSLVMSVFMAAATIYKYIYHAGIRADRQGMKDIPLDKSVVVKIFFTNKEFTLLSARLAPHSREVRVPTKEERDYQDRKNGMRTAAAEAEDAEQHFLHQQQQRKSGDKSGEGAHPYKDVEESAFSVRSSGLTSPLVDPVSASAEYQGYEYNSAGSAADVPSVSAPPTPTVIKHQTHPSTNASSTQANASANAGGGSGSSSVASSVSASVISQTCPAELICPLSRRIMTDPVFCGDGYTYERSAIEQHFTSQRELLVQLGHADALVTSPITKQPIESTQLIPNKGVQAAVSAYYASRD